MEWITIIILLFLLATLLWARLQENKALDNRFCKCGDLSRMILFAIETQGGRGFQCSVCGKYVFICYEVDTGNEIINKAAKV